MLNIRHKYVDNELIGKQVDLTIKNDFNPPMLVGAESQNESDMQLQKSICILELVNMIGNITNTLNFELKSASLRQAQITELEMQVENARMRSDEAITETEKNMINARKEIE